MFKPTDLFELKHTEHAALFEGCDYAWQALKKIREYLTGHTRSELRNRCEGRAYIGPEVYIGEGTVVEDGVMINSVGIGSAEGAPIMDPSTNEYKKDENGTTVVSRLNETELQQLAGATKGIYVKLNEVDAAVDAITKQLSTIETSTLDDNAFRDYRSYFQWFLAFAFVLLIAEFLLPERKLKAA